MSDSSIVEILDGDEKGQSSTHPLEKAVLAMDADQFVTSLMLYIDDSTSEADLRRLKEFLGKSAAALNAKIATAEKQQFVATQVEHSSSATIDFADLSMLEPRGRFKLRIGKKNTSIEGKLGVGAFEFDNINIFLLLPHHTSSKKDGEDLLIVIFKDAVKICGKDMTSIVFSLGKGVTTKSSPEGSIVETESKMVTSAFGAATDMKIQQPSAQLFRSVTQQKPFIRCHKGVSEGAIYPLHSGLLFFKPLIFIPADEIASLTAGRGGGSGNTRFVDLQIETAAGKTIEFSNIEREELPALNAYVKNFLEVRKRKAEDYAKPAARSSSNPADMLANFNEDDDDDDDEDDGDYRPGDTESEDEGGDSGSDDDEDQQATSKKRKAADNSDSDDSDDEEDGRQPAKKKAAVKVKKSPKKVKAETSPNENRPVAEKNSMVIEIDRPVAVKSEKSATINLLDTDEVQVIERQIAMEIVDLDA